MSCSGCPGDAVGDGSISPSVLATIPPIFVFPYGVGLRCLEFTIMPGAQVVILDGGAIEFQPVEGWLPEDISGYERDEGNPFLFRPLWLECEARYHATKFKPNGSMDVLMVCACKESEHNNNFVDHAACAACPVRKPVTNE